MARVTRGVASHSARGEKLVSRRNEKMARSAHAYVRGNTARFYEWLDAAEIGRFPDGPAIWICGDCHTGNLGPVADAAGNIDIQIRDLDQTVIGNPVHDVIRLGLSLATAARGSSLSGATTIAMIGALFDGYVRCFAPRAQPSRTPKPDVVRLVMREAMRRSWKHLARERLSGVAPTIPLGKRFWPLSRKERAEIDGLFQQKAISGLATGLRGRPDTGNVEVLDAAYWVKGCSSLGRLRYAVLLDVDGNVIEGDDLCLIDIKEGTTPAAPRYKDARMPRDNATRVVEGARNLAPLLGERMRPASIDGRSVIVRELLPQDLKLEIEQVGQDDAMQVARYLATVVGRAHARQLDASARKSWHRDLTGATAKSFDMPLWLWRGVVELVGQHETGYLEHCRAHSAPARR